MKLKGDDGPDDIRLRAREENLEMVHSRTYGLYEMAYGMFHGREKGRDKGRKKHRKAERKERKCSGGVWAVADMLASLSSMFQHCKLS